MNNFKYCYYHIINQKVENEFEPIFRDFKKQLYIYERQYKLTSKAYIKEWESELKNNEINYRKLEAEANIIYKKEIEGYEEDYDAHSYAMHSSGLEIISQQYISQKEEIDNEYKNFLDLYSKSILIAIYSLNESKLNTIINKASNIFNKKIKPSHFGQRDYLNSSIQYLNLVVEIDTRNLETYISKLKDLQFLRNGIVHNSSIYPEFKTASKIASKYKGSLTFNISNNSIKITKSNFIEKCFQLLKNFYEELFWLLDLKLDSAIIKNGLIYWLGILDKKIEINCIKFDKFYQSEKSISFKITLQNESKEEYSCKITLTNSKENSFEFINQTKNKEIQEFLEYEKQVKGNNMMMIFTPFNINNNNFKKNIIIY
ncbi:hypothetical protein KUL156_54040 [Alteromonas sp. KUL156]|nr:hypothetical protein KUL156_54040 [Alteromonas sp. KUL156]